MGAGTYQVCFYYTANDAEKSIYQTDYADQQSAQADADLIKTSALWTSGPIDNLTYYTGVYSAWVEAQ